MRFRIKIGEKTLGVRHSDLLYVARVSLIEGRGISSGSEQCHNKDGYNRLQYKTLRLENLAFRFPYFGIYGILLKHRVWHMSSRGLIQVQILPMAGFDLFAALELKSCNNVWKCTCRCTSRKRLSRNLRKRAQLSNHMKPGFSSLSPPRFKLIQTLPTGEID